MTIRTEIQAVITSIEDLARDHSALALKVSRVAKTASREEQREIMNALRMMKDSVAGAHAMALAEVATPTMPTRKPKHVTEQGHHFREDLACPACGTDSSVGCTARPR